MKLIRNGFGFVNVVAVTALAQLRKINTCSIGGDTRVDLNADLLHAGLGGFTLLTNLP